MIGELVDLGGESGGRNMGVGLEYVRNVIKGGCRGFVLWELMEEESFKNGMSIGNGKDDVVGIEV